MIITSLDTNKIIDVEALSKYCQLCTNSMEKEHKCTKNCDGYSGSLEVGEHLEYFGTLQRYTVFMICSTWRMGSLGLQKMEEAR
jgi:hypothetical protein